MLTASRGNHSWDLFSILILICCPSQKKSDWITCGKWYVLSMFLVFEMPVGMLLQSALAAGRSRLNLFPMTGQRSCLDQKKLSIGCRFLGSWLTDGREVASCFPDYLPSSKSPWRQTCRLWFCVCKPVFKHLLRNSTKNSFCCGKPGSPCRTVPELLPWRHVIVLGLPSFA